MKRKAVLLCILGVCMVLGGRPAFALAVTTASDIGTVAVENPAYRVVISEVGGTIKSLILKSTGKDMAGGEGGIAGDIEAIANERNMAEDYRLKIVKQSQDEVQVSAVLEDSGIVYTKMYVFREDTPLIFVRVQITNHGSPRSFAYRVFNAVTPDGRSSGNTYFVDKTFGPEILQLLPSTKPNTFIKDSTATGWTGAFNPASHTALLCKAAPDAVDQYLIYLSQKIATVEWYYKRISLDTGTVFSTEYFILPLSNVTSVTASIAAANKIAGGKILATKVKNPAPVQKVSGAVQDTVLVVGAFNVFNIFDPYSYRIVQSLAKVPDLKVSLCPMSMLEKPRYKSHYLKGFPSSVSGLANYRAVIMIDTPAWALDSSMQESLAEYVKAGGILVMAGDHARGYKGSKLAEIFPLSFDYSTEMKGWHGTVMKDKSGWLKPAVTGNASPILDSIDCAEMPNVVVHKSIPAADARVIMKAGEYPLVADRRLGKGRVISFPISVTDQVVPGADRPDGIAVGSNYWDDKITTWNFYDELWRNIVFCNDAAAVSLAKISVPKKEVVTPAEIKIGACIVNNTSSSHTGAANFILQKDGKIFRTDTAAYTANSGKAERLDFKVNLPPVRGNYTYRIEVKDSTGKLVTWLDGDFFAHPKTWVKMDLPLIKVFRREGTVRSTVTIMNPAQADVYSIKTYLEDSAGRLVQQLPPTSIDSTSQAIKQQMKLANLRNGEYRLVSKLVLCDHTIDLVSANIYIAPEIDKENFYPNIIYATFGAVSNDIAKSLEAVRNIREVGFNGIQFYNFGRYRKDRRDVCDFSCQCAAYEEAQKLGMVFVPFASYGNTSWNQWWRGSMILSSDGFDKAKEEDALAYYDAFRESPRNLAVCLADEPSIAQFPWWKDSDCKAAFKTRFGQELTNDKKSRNYYDSFKFIADRQADMLKYGTSFFKKYNPDTGTWAALNLGDSMFNTNINKVASTLDYPGIDHYEYRADPYALDLLWSASDFSDRMWLVPTTSILYDNKYYPEYAGLQAYYALCHNAKGMAWWIWDGIFGIDDNARENPPSMNYFKRVCAELSTLGPLFNHISRARSDIAMLFPWTTSILSTDTRTQDVRLWKDTHILLRRAFGQVDFLHEEQIRRGVFLPDSKVLVLAGARYLPEDVAQKIKDWTAAGGILIILPGPPAYNQYQEKSDTLSEICSAEYGAEISAPVKGGSGIPVRGFVLNPSTAQILLQYNNGSAAATSATYGTGRVICFGFEPDNALVANAVKEAAIGRAVSSNHDIDVSYFPADGGFYVTAVNQIRKDVYTEIKVQKSKSPCYAYDILTGKEVPCVTKNGTVTISVGIEPMWGKVIACLPSKPAKLLVTATNGKDRSCNIKLINSTGNLVNARLPVTITVTDSEGRERPEYGGIRILGGGQLTMKLHPASNDPAGRWQIAASEEISRHTAKVGLYVGRQK